jgi:hypothetical protein
MVAPHGSPGPNAYQAGYPPPPGQASSGVAQPPPRKGFWRRVISFFDSTTKILVTLASLIGAAAGLWAAVQHITRHPDPTPSPVPAVIAGPSTGSADQQNAAQVNACEKAHQLTQQRQRATASESVTVFSSCTWPAPTYAQADGFAQITVTVVAGPGQSEASGADWVDRITGPCAHFTLTYDFGSQGSADHLQPFDLAAGSVTSVDKPGQAWTGNTADFSFYPERDEVDVVRNGRYAVFDVACKA